jgi:hypothetical protein
MSVMRKKCVNERKLKTKNEMKKIGMKLIQMNGARILSIV